MTDKEIDVDEDVNVSEWEADFIESVVYEYSGPLSQKQRAAAEKIVERYYGRRNTAGLK